MPQLLPEFLAIAQHFSHVAFHVVRQKEQNTKQDVEIHI